MAVMAANVADNKAQSGQERNVDFIKPHAPSWQQKPATSKSRTVSTITADIGDETGSPRNPSACPPYQTVADEAAAGRDC
jgi:hypothetical protein